MELAATRPVVGSIRRADPSRASRKHRRTRRTVPGAQFLRILCPLAEHLKDEGKLDFADHRDWALGALAALAKRLPRSGHRGDQPVLSATADLLKTVAELPEAPSFCRDSIRWTSIRDRWNPPILRLKTARRSRSMRGGRPWPGTESRQSPRVRLLGEVTRASETTERWADMSLDVESALVGVKRIDAPSPGEEAAAVALVMRGVVETPEIRCALVTPDRGLARRVAAMLKRWNLTVDDSAGLPLSRTEAGTFFDLLSEAVADDFAPAAFLALLKHPFCLANRKRTELFASPGPWKSRRFGVRARRPDLEGVARTLDKKPEMLESLLADIDLGDNRLRESAIDRDNSRRALSAPMWNPPEPCPSPICSGRGKRARP